MRESRNRRRCKLTFSGEQGQHLQFTFPPFANSSVYLQENHPSSSHSGQKHTDDVAEVKLREMSGTNLTILCEECVCYLPGEA